MDEKWLAAGPPQGDGVRLFCLSYAGGSSTAYRGWAKAAPDGVVVCPVEIPGRGVRFQEPPFTRMKPLAAELARALRPALHQPFALFGHSMGGLLAFEVARALRARDWPQPEHLFVSAVAAPGTPSARPTIHTGSNDDLKQELRFLNGTPQELLEDDELMDLMLPTIRADFAVLETYEYRVGEPLTVPITVFGGTADQCVPVSALAGWHGQTRAGSQLELFAGDHFFLHPERDTILSMVARDLSRVPSRLVS